MGEKPEEAERRDFQHGQCRGGGAMRDPNVDPGRQLSIFLVFNSSHFLYVPGTLYLVIAHFVGAVVWQSGDARPDLGGDVQKIIGPSTPASKIFCLSVFQKQSQPTSSVGVPATLNILSSWSKTSLGKHRGAFVSFLKRSFSLSKMVDT